MIDKSIEFINNNRACVDVIGVRGICDKEYQYYLDNLGISLNKAAKLADSAFLNGKNLIDNSIKMPVTLSFGHTYRGYINNCNLDKIIEIQINTNLGNWTFKR